MDLWAIGEQPSAVEHALVYPQDGAGSRVSITLTARLEVLLVHQEAPDDHWATLPFVILAAIDTPCHIH